MALLAFVNDAEQRKSAASNWNACIATNYWCNYDDSCRHVDNNEQNAGVHGNNATHLLGGGLVDNDGALEKGGRGGGNASSSSAAEERRRRRRRRKGALEGCNVMSLDQD